MIHGPESLSTLSVILDFILVAASIGMVFIVRGIGGIVGSAMSFIVSGAIVLGIAHLVATFGGAGYLEIFDGPTNQFVHRLIVLLGFVLLSLGFRRMAEIKR